MFHGKVGTVTVTTVDLMASEQTRSAISEANSLAYGSFLQAGPISVPQTGGMPDHLPGHFDLGRHVGQPEQHRLMLDDGHAERFPFLGVAHGGFGGAAMPTDWAPMAIRPASRLDKAIL